VASLLRQSAARGQIEVDDPELAADMFLNLVLGHCRRLVLCGSPADPKTEERHREAAVDFFPIGVRTE
jgi:TetR/AcrR family transcriptional repressor of mexJK operon